jgi:hypothetical protein
MNWNFEKYGRVELIQARGGKLCLSAADDKSDPAFTFGEDDLDRLFKVVANSAIDAHGDHFVIFGDKLKENGKPAELPAAKLKDSGYNLAYESWQFEKVTPKRVVMLVSFRKPKLGIYTTDYKPKGGFVAKPKARLTINAFQEAPQAPQAPQAPAKRQPRNV